jgi:vacuolar-type H+-ATPase subunit E/Vma4
VEVVKNGELLEAQVTDDARAKARRLLETADRECQLIRSEGEKRLQEDLRRVDEGRDQRLATLRREMESSLPLDFRRTRLAFLEQCLEKALAAYFAGLAAAEVRSLLGGQLRRAATAFSGRRVVVRHAGVDGAEARRILAESLPGAVVDTTVEMDAEAAAAAVKGLVVECSDGSRRCRATFQELTLLLLDEHREELVTALFGKDALAGGAERQISS